MSKLHQLAELGQSVWFDYIRRAFIESGELQALIDQGLRGVTSNPSIFEKAIAGSADYDQAMHKLVNDNKSIDEIYEALALEDIAAAADLMLPVYKSTNRLDGYVSFEVSPKLAHDTEKTVFQAKRLFKELGRPNVMIKVPATQEGIPAIQELIASGINVNVTLLFDNDNYRQVAQAYILGLEKRYEQGENIDGIASVASFFISRVDSAVDEAIAAKGNTDLQGKIAIANSKLAYKIFNSLFSGADWSRLANAGAAVQRLLWASTSTKNPNYPDTLYVDELIGYPTVNTIPPATLTAFQDHGTVKETLTKGLDEAEPRIAKLKELGIDLGQITKELQEVGVAKFSKSFDSLLESIAQKREKLLADIKDFSADLGEFQESVDIALADLKENQVIKRIWEHDHKVWEYNPSEIGNRLGWLHSPEIMEEHIPQIGAFVENVKADGFTHVLLLGMGGSSLSPEVFRKTFGVKEGYLDLAVLDSTDPSAVLQHAEKFDPAKTLFIVSTKSGGTVETLSFFKYFYNLTLDAVGGEQVGQHFVAITDPGSGLAKLAEELKFRRIFLNDPNIGGRYSALSYFGLVPAALIGMDLELLLDRAQRMACNCDGCNCAVAGNNSGAWLGAIMGELALAGRDKLTLIASPGIEHFGAWVEQLIAESTGKNGKGILPVDGEDLAAPDVYRDDRLFVYLQLEGDTTYKEKIEALKNAGHPVVRLHLKDLYDLGEEFFRWEMATAVAGSRLGINPFDQPNVESAKVAAKNMVTAFQKEGKLPELQPTLSTNGIQIFSDGKATTLKEAVDSFFAKENKANGSPRSYVSIQAYVQPNQETDSALQKLRLQIRDKFKLATTVGYGPRFLHSTGQLHKGDGGHGLFIQITNETLKDAPIPDQPGGKDSSMTFGVLKMAQALGDRQALLDAKRNVIRFHLQDVAEGLKQITESIS